MLDTLERPPSDASAMANGVLIVRTANNCFGVTVSEQRTPRVLRVSVDHRGRRCKEDFFDATRPYRDALGVNMAECVVRVTELDGTILCELGEPPQGGLYQPWMVQQGQQQHVTENYVSVPPALHLTDAAGSRWTLGFLTAPPDLSPEGEYAFNVLRDGCDAGAVASRLELRNGVVRCFTRRGWKRWLGREWS